MSGSPMRVEAGTLGLLVVTLLLVTPDTIRADERFRVTPSVSATTLHETNLFSTPSARQADIVTRLSSSADAEYRAAIWTVFGRCSFDIEHFADHPELTTLDARRHAELGIKYFPTRKIAIAADAELSRTHTPGELNGDTGLAFARAAAGRVAISASLTRHFDRETAGTLAYSLMNDSLTGSLSTRVHEAKIGAERHLSSRQTGHVGYRAQSFEFAEPTMAAASAISQTFTIGATHSVTRQTAISVDAGPQVGSGSVAPAILAVLEHHTAPFDLALSYGRTQAVVFGLAGTADTQSVTTSASWTLRRALQIRVSPAFFQSTFSTLRSDVYRLAIDVVKPVTPGIAVGFAFDAGVQRGNLFTRSAGAIPLQTMAIRLIASPPVRPH